MSAVADQSDPMLDVSGRARALQPFHVMRMMQAAQTLTQRGVDVVHMEVGEPDFTTPTAIAQAAIAAIERGQTHYTAAAGLPELRAALVAYYRERGAVVEQERLLVTPGGSGALQMALLASVDVGDEVLITDPGYPCNRQLIALAGARPVAVPVDARTRYQPTPELLERYVTPATRALMLASPGNPTGSVLHATELRALADWARRRGLRLIVDEIYHGLTYAHEAVSAAAIAPQALVINSFSKFYGMTGWRLGWLLAPTELQQACERLAQNLFIAAPTPAQHAACTALSASLLPELEQRREVFRQRRDYLVPALRELGFVIPCVPEGAFYVYADCSVLTDDSEVLCERLLHEAAVVVTPGLDFGQHQAKRYLRFAFTKPLERLREGVARMQRFFASSVPSVAD